jgi:hypothetical protein
MQSINFYDTYAGIAAILLFATIVSFAYLAIRCAFLQTARPRITWREVSHLLFRSICCAIGAYFVVGNILQTPQNKTWLLVTGVGGGLLAAWGEWGVLEIIETIVEKQRRVPFWLNEWLFKFLLLMIGVQMILSEGVMMTVNHALWEKQSTPKELMFSRVAGSLGLGLGVIVFFGGAFAYGYRYVQFVKGRLGSTHASRLNARNDVRAFILLLRPFNIRALFEHNATRGLYGVHIPDASVSILTLLEQAVSATAPMIVLSDVDTPIRDRQWSSLVVNSTDANWRELFQLLARSCKAMVIVPANSPGLIHEITSIMSSRMLDRCVFYQPPVYYMLPDVLAHLGAEIHTDIVRDMKTNWEKITKLYKQLGLELPAFDSEGSFFCLNSDASLCACKRIGSIHGQDQIVSIHKAAFNYVLSRINRTGRPLNEIITQIETIEGE